MEGIVMRYVEDWWGVSCFLFNKGIVICIFFFKQKTAYEIKECDWSSDVCSSDLALWLMDKTIHGVIHRFRTRFRFDRLSDIASLPLVLIFVTVISFVFQPITNSASRDRKSVVQGKSVDLGGRRIIKKKTIFFFFSLSSFFFFSMPSVSTPISVYTMYSVHTSM